MENNTFKGSIFGGFNRQDVMNYIEKASRESGELLQQNQEQIAALEQENTQLRDQCEQLRVSLQDTVASLSAAQAERDAAQASCASAGEALENAQRSNRQYTEEINTLQATVAALQPEVDKFHTLQKNIADVEVEAKHRADTLVAEARASAEEILRKARTQADAVLSAAKADAEKIRSEANGNAAAIRQKADQHAMLSRQQLHTLLNSTHAQYQALLEMYKSSALQAATALQKAQEQMTQMPAVFDKISAGMKTLQSSREKKDG